MNPKTLFDFHSYLFALTEKNKLARTHAFYPCYCSGISYLEEMLSNSRNHKAFVCLTDTSEDSTTRKSGGWFKRRVFTVFILCRYNTRSQDDYREKLGICRELFRQLHSRFLIDEHDLHLLDVNRRASSQPDARSASQAGAGNRASVNNELAYLDVENIRSRELGGQFLNGCTGLYFMLAIDEPVDLQYDKDEWNE